MLRFVPLKIIRPPQRAKDMAGKISDGFAKPPIRPAPDWSASMTWAICEAVCANIGAVRSLQTRRRSGCLNFGTAVGTGSRAVFTTDDNMP
jgi:hypothetical protein